MHKRNLKLSPYLGDRRRDVRTRLCALRRDASALISIRAFALARANPSCKSLSLYAHRSNGQWDRVFCNIMQPLSLSGRGKVPFKSCGRLSADNGPVRVPHCHLTCPLGLGGPGWGYCLGGKRWWGLRGVGESGRGRRACGARPSPPQLCLATCSNFGRFCTLCACLYSRGVCLLRAFGVLTLG